MLRSKLAVRAGAAPVLVLLLSSLAFFAGDARPALAFDPGGYLPVSIPATVAAVATATDGAGTILSVGAAVTAVPVAVAVSGLAVGAAAGLAGTAAVKFLWDWAAGTSSTYADAPVQPAGTVPAGSYWSSSYQPAGQAGSCPGNAFALCINMTNNTGGSQVGYISALPTLGYSGAFTIKGGNNLNNDTLGVNGCTPGYNPTSPYASFSVNVTCTSFQSVSISASGTTYGTMHPSGTYAPATGGGAPGAQVVTTTPTSACTPNAGGAVQSVAGAAITYTRNDTTLPPIIAPACPAGTTRTGFTTPSTGAAGATVPSPLAPWTAPTLPTGFPECQPAGRCQLVLTRVYTDGSEVPCSGNTDCDGWEILPKLAPVRTVKTITKPYVPTDAANGTDNTTNLPRRWPDGSFARCMWGPYELASDECTVVPTKALAAPPAVDTNGNPPGCFHGMGISPLTWPTGLILSPLKCLFVPDATKTQADVSSVKAAASGTFAGSVYDVISTALAPVTGLTTATKGDCMGPQLSLPVPFYASSLSFYPLDACPQEVQDVLAIWMPLVTALLYLGTLYGTYRAVTRATVGADGLVTSA